MMEDDNNLEGKFHDGKISDEEHERLKKIARESNKKLAINSQEILDTFGKIIKRFDEGYDGFLNPRDRYYN